MADERLIPSSIKDDNTEAFNELIDGLGSLDITPLLIYIIDSVEATALPHLAEQFHVMGLEGWNLCETEAEKRALIQKAIELHRHKGTPWAIKEALKSAGYEDAVIEEGLPGIYYDGSINFNGYERYEGNRNRWAVFRVLLDIGEIKGLTAAQRKNVIALINEYKNVRSHLRDLYFTSNPTETIDTPIDEAEIEITEFFYYSGKQNYDGTEEYDGLIGTISEVL